MKDKTELIYLKRVILTIKNYILVFLSLVFVGSLYFWKLKIKNCFVGSCLLEIEYKMYLQFLPKKIEYSIYLVLFCFIIFNNKPQNELKCVILYEFIYFLYNSVDLSTKYYKYLYLNNYRFDDYCSIHDFNIVINAVIMLLFIGTNRNDLREWTSAMREETDCHNDKETDELILRIKKLSQEKNRIKV